MPKFSEIEQFVREGDYEVNVCLGHLEQTLENYERDYGLLLNSDFQRGYLWTEEQQVAYLEFFLRGGKTARVIYFNSPAFGGYTADGDLDDTILCVDGLQRLTALRRFLNNEIRVFGHYYDEYEDRKQLGIRQSVKFNINCLKNKVDVLKWYVQFNSGGTVHTKEEIDRVKAMITELESV